MGRLDDFLNKTKVIEFAYFDENDKLILYQKFSFNKKIKLMQELTAFILFHQEAPGVLRKVKEMEK